MRHSGVLPCVRPFAGSGLVTRARLVLPAWSHRNLLASSIRTSRRCGRCPWMLVTSEDLVVANLAAACGIERWQAFAELDEILDNLAAGADDRLAYQVRFPIRP